MIKKVIFAVVVIALFVSLWMHLRSSTGIQITRLQGETVVLKKGNLTIPIEANGTIEPKDRVDIKSEAGGTVDETPVDVGRMVTEGSLLVKLNPEDEQRRLDIANKFLQQAEINQERTTVILYQREHVDVPNMRARLAETVADFEYWDWKYQKYRDLLEEAEVHKDEYRQYKASFLRARARKQQLEAELERAVKNIDLAELEVKQTNLAVARARDDLADAQERLNETKIVAPFDGMLIQLFQKRGAVISSASQSFTGGTLLARMANVSELYVLAEVDEADIGRVHEIAPPSARPGSSDNVSAMVSFSDDLIPMDLGTPVKVTVEAFPDEEFAGIIELIEPEPKKVGQVATYLVHIRLISGNSKKLYLGMQATVEFVAEKVQDAVLVPNEAVRYYNGRRGVFVPVDSVTEPGKKRPKFKRVKLGLDNGAFSQVIEGLEEGDEVYKRLPRNREGREDFGEE